MIETATPALTLERSPEDPLRSGRYPKVELREMLPS